MSRRNLIWLVVVLVAGFLVGIAAGWLWGVLAAAVTLAISEIVERARRQRLRAERGAEGSPSIKDAVTNRRRRR